MSGVTCKNVTISFVQASKFTLLTVTYSPVGLYLARFTTIKSSKPLPERQSTEASVTLLEALRGTAPAPDPSIIFTHWNYFWLCKKTVIVPSGTTFLACIPLRGILLASRIILSFKFRTEAKTVIRGIKDRFQAASADCTAPPASLTYHMPLSRENL